MNPARFWPLYIATYDGGGWVRWRGLGHGLAWTKTPRFSVRMGLVRSLRIGPWWVSYLEPFRGTCGRVHGK